MYACNVVVRACVFASVYACEYVCACVCVYVCIICELRDLMFRLGAYRAGWRASDPDAYNRAKLSKFCCHCCLVYPTLRDNEAAVVSANGQTCWTKRDLVGSTGTKMCGGWTKDQIFRVTGCDITLFGPPGALVPLTVFIWTSLDSDASEESFGIDNVVISKPGGDAAGIYDWVNNV